MQNSDTKDSDLNVETYLLERLNLSYKIAEEIRIALQDESLKKNSQSEKHLELNTDAATNEDQLDLPDKTKGEVKNASKPPTSENSNVSQETSKLKKASNLLMTTYFVHQADPVKRKGGRMKFNVSIIEEFLSNVDFFFDNMDVVLFIDWTSSVDFPIDLVRVDFTNVSYSINDYRYFLFRDYLSAHVEYERILIVDFKDVRYGRDPFLFMLSMPEMKLFVGSEQNMNAHRRYSKYKMTYCYGQRSNVPQRIKDAVDFSRKHAKNNRTVLANAGIFGGERSYVMKVLTDMIGLFSYSNDSWIQGCNSNMIVFLTALVPYYKQNLVFAGPPWHSPFTHFLEPNGSYAIYHKQTDELLITDPIVEEERKSHAQFVANKNCPNAWAPYFHGVNFTTDSIRGTKDYIVVAGRLTCVLAWSIFSILKYQQPKRVLIISLNSVCENMLLPENVYCIDEETWIPGLQIDAYRDYFNSKMDVVGSRIFWYWQQMLKMGSVYREDISEEFVLVDADVIFQRPFTYKNADGKYIFIPGGGKTKQYYNPVERFLGHKIHMPKGRTSSYVAHSLIVNKQFLKEMLSAHDSWWKEIINLAARKFHTYGPDLPPWMAELQRIFGFSEYMFYTSAFIEEFPDDFLESDDVPFIRDKEIRNSYRDFCPTLETMGLVKNNSDGRQNTPIIVWELEHGKVSKGSKNEKNKKSLHAPYPSCEKSPKMNIG